MRRDPLARLAGRLRPHAGQLGLAAVLLVIGGAAPGAVVWLVQRLLDEVLVRRDAEMLRRLPFAVIALYATSAIAAYVRARITRGVALEVVRDLRQEVHDHVLRLPAGTLTREHSAARVTLLVADIDDLQQFISGVVTLVQRPVTLVVLLGSAFALQPGLAATALVVAPLLAWMLARVNRWVRVTAQAAQRSRASLATAAQESMGHARQVRLLGALDARRAAFSARNRAHAEASAKAIGAQAASAPAAEVTGAVAIALAIAIGGRDVLAGRLQAGELVAFLVALGLLHEPMKGLSQVQTMLARARVSADRVFGVLDTPAGPLWGGVAPAPLVELSVDGLGFAYSEAKVLRGFDLVVKAGERVALVGPSGAGKTTLLHLLARLDEPAVGRVLWNGAPLGEHTREGFHDRVAFVPQEPVLFDDTLRGNLALGITAPDQDLDDMLVRVGLGSWRQSLPDGLDTAMAELGANVSGGQRQRLCVARALLRRPSLLLLDEPTSSLDAESEKAVLDVLSALPPEATVIMVTHGSAPLAGMTRVVSLEDGRIGADGARSAGVA